jgi:hypothetical protein
MPPSIHCIQNNTFTWGNIAVGGARLWDSSEYTFSALVEYKDNPRAKIKTEEEIARDKEERERIFVRELERLKMSLDKLPTGEYMRIAMTHYPPIGTSLQPSRASSLLEEHKIDICVFGHLHNLKKGPPLFGKARGVDYHLTSCDYLDFSPLKIL